MTRPASSFPRASEPPAVRPMSLAVACRRLIGMYDVVDWWPARSRFEVMVGAVLVQNSRWANVAAAIRQLRAARCLTPTKMSTLEIAQLTILIRPAGCQSIKAQRLRAMADWVQRCGGLRSLARWDTGRLRRELLAINGIGHETADAILCFAFDRARFVADKYARQWIDRMGLAAFGDPAGYEACREFVESGLDEERINLADLHAAIVLHAQSTCGARPACHACGLRANCRQGQRSAS